MTTMDLKPCYVVKTRNGKLGIVAQAAKEGFVINFKNGIWDELTCFNCDLTHMFNRDYDIMEVYGFSSYACASLEITTAGRKLLTEKPAREMTVKEIEKILGFNIIIKEED